MNSSPTGIRNTRSGDAARARDLYARVLELAVAADTPLPEVAQAKRFLGRG